MAPIESWPSALRTDREQQPAVPRYHRRNANHQLRESLHKHRFSRHQQEKRELPPCPIFTTRSPAWHRHSPLSSGRERGHRGSSCLPGEQRGSAAVLGTGGKTPEPPLGRASGRGSTARASTVTNRHQPPPQQGGALRAPARAGLPRAGVRVLCSHWLPTRKRSWCEDMEAAVRQREQRGAAADGGRGPSLSGQSYWLDLWLFVLFDLALFVVIYLLP